MVCPFSPPSMPKLGIQGLKNPQSPSPNPHLFQHLPHFTLQNHKIALSRVSRQPPPRCSRGRGGGLEFTVICTGFAGWWTATTGRDGSTKARDGSTMGRDGSTMARDGSTMTRDGSLKQHKTNYSNQNRQQKDKQN